MVVSEGAINNIMGGMENTAGVRLHSHRHKLKQRFDIVRKLGQGTYGKVQLAINKETGQEVAIKTIKKAKIETEQDLVRIRREIQIMSSVQHPQIIHIYEVFENREKMVLVMEYAAGGELYDYLSERKVLPEIEARRVFRQVASAVYYCHKHKICHRDLKLENILLDLDGNAKIADFGLSNVFDEKQRLDTFCGSPLYASPEIVKGVPYVGPEVDCWSLGVLLYTLVYGAMPFDGSNFRRLVKQITQGDFYEPSTPATASSLVRHMLTVQSTERATIEDICNNWWVNEGYTESCLKEAEALANQTPVRLDLLLSLAPKHISSEHMLIQPDEEDVSQKSESERAAPNLKLPPPPALPDGEVENGVAPPLRSHSLGAVPPPGGVNVDMLLEKKSVKKKKSEKSDSSSQKPPSRPPNEEERKKKEKKSEISAEREAPKKDSSLESAKKDSSTERVKKRDSSTERVKKRDSSTERAKKRDSSTERVKKRDSSTERVKKRESSTERGKKRESSPEREKKVVRKKDTLIAKKKSSSPIKKEEEEKGSSPVRGSKSPSKTPVPEPLPEPKPENLSEPKPAIPKRSPVSKTDSSSRKSSVTGIKKPEPEAPVTKPEPVAKKEDDRDTETILKETAAKIEKTVVEDGLLTVSPVTSPATSLITSPVTSPPLTSPIASSSHVSSLATSPIRSRTGSESSTDANRPISSTRSESGSRRQSKILSKAALFDPGLSTSEKSMPTNSTSVKTPKKITRPGALNMSDLTKKFEEKPSAGDSRRGSKVVAPFKVSDARKAFENKSDKSVNESPRRKASVGSSGGESTSLSPKDSLPTSPRDSKPTSPTRIDKVPISTPSAVKVNKTLSKNEREVSPVKKTSKSPTKDVSPLKKGEKSPPKKETSPTKSGTKPVSKIRSGSKLKEETKEIPGKIETGKPVAAAGKDVPAVSKPKRLTDSGSKMPGNVSVTIPVRVESDSSESESEAEKMLRQVSEKREKLEIAKKEKMKEVSVGREVPGTPTTPVPSQKDVAGLREEAPEKEKYATLPRGFKAKVDPNKTTSPKIVFPRVNSLEESRSGDSIRKKSQMEIVLNQPAKQPQQPITRPYENNSNRSSFAEIHIAEGPRPEYRTEVQHNVVTPQERAAPEPQLHRARRERIIPIMLEDDQNDAQPDNDVRMTSSRSSMIQPSLSSSSSKASSVASSSRASSGFGGTLASEKRKGVAVASQEPIRKSRRERIIPIAVEGEGLMTPPITESTSTDTMRNFQRQGSSHSAFNRNRGFAALDRAESFSSAGEDEEEEEDGFQILTAESLFSTLLSRVRSLTRKMANDDTRNPGSGSNIRRVINSDNPLSSGASGGSSSGFWSSLYSPPGELPGSRLSRGHSRDDDPFAGFGAPMWGRGLSRDNSDNETAYSDSSAPFSTLPRGWRATRSGREERESVLERDKGISSFTPSRRQFYSRTLSRDLKPDADDALKRPGTRTSWDASSSSSTLPRPCAASGSTLPPKYNQEPIDRITNAYNQSSFKPSDAGVSRDKLERHLSTAGNSSATPSGEITGRVGGQFDQRGQNLVASVVSPSLNKDQILKPKKSVQQLKDLVNELEAVPNDRPVSSEKGKVTFKLTPSGSKGQLSPPKASKSLTSFQKQNSFPSHSGSNPNIVFNVTLCGPNETHPAVNSTPILDPREKLKPTKSASNDICATPKNSFSTKSSNVIDNDVMTNNISKQTESPLQSVEKVPKNIFIPYNPNLNQNNTSHKNLYVDKQISTIPKEKHSIIPAQGVNDIKNERRIMKQGSDRELCFNESGKRNGYAVGADPSSESLKHSRSVGQSLIRPQSDHPKKSLLTDTKNVLVVEPYRRGRSEDLKATIEIANASNPAKDGGTRGPMKVYRKSRSRDITPAIEAASEKFTQLNSGTLKRISPFEAYRRSKSKELGSVIDMANSNKDLRTKSPPPAEASLSQFEKAKNSIEKKFEKAMSPPLDAEMVKESRARSPEPIKDLSKTANTPTDVKKEKEKDISKDNATKEPEKPKSVYKIITSKFSRSLSNVGEEKQGLKQATKDTEEENEKDDKLKIKRPGRFLRSKMEKSSSKTSILEMEPKDEEETEKKPTKKLSNALNKFLGRKSDDSANKESKTNSPVLPKKSTSAAIITEKSKKPPRFKTKMFSKSHENLNQKEDDDELEDNVREERAKSVFPNSPQTSDVTLESATKDICNHLSQIEINIASRIGNMSQSASSPPNTINSPNSNKTPTISYSLTPASASTKGSSIQESKTRKSSPLPLSDSDIYKKKSNTDLSEDGSITPSESGNDLNFSGLEDIKEADDESVMDRITRKSYYSRFNDTKRKPKSKRIDSREMMDQQLAAAKARLLQDDPESMIALRESTTPQRLTPTSPPAVWDGVTRRSGKINTGPRTTSLPPDDGMGYYFGGIRNNQIISPPPDVTVKPMRNHSIERDDQVFYRSNSVTRDDPIPYRRQTTANLDEVSNLKRLSTSRDDPSFYIRQPSTPLDEDFSYRLPSVVNDESPTYRRLSSAMKDEPLTYRRSSVAKDDSKTYRRLSSNYGDENSSETKVSSTPRDNVGLKRYSASNLENDSGFHSNSSEDPTYSKYVPSNRDSLHLQYGRNERLSDAGSRSPSISPSITINARPQENVDETWVEPDRSEQLKLASAAGKAAGEAAASAVSNYNSTERIPSPISPKPSEEAAAVTSAREELTRRLTPLTRLSNMGNRDSTVRPYRRTVTSGSLPISQTEVNKPPVERPTYRRTTTSMDLPPTDPRIRTTDYRRMLQDPTRRFTGIRSTDRPESQVMSHLPSMTSSLPSRSSFSSYSPLSLSYSPQNVNMILRRSSMYRY